MAKVLALMKEMQVAGRANRLTQRRLMTGGMDAAIAMVGSFGMFRCSVKVVGLCGIPIHVHSNWETRGF